MQSPPRREAPALCGTQVISLPTQNLLSAHATAKPPQRSKTTPTRTQFGLHPRELRAFQMARAKAGRGERPTTETETALLVEITLTRSRDHSHMLTHPQVAHLVKAAEAAKSAAETAQAAAELAAITTVLVRLCVWLVSSLSVYE